MVGRGRRPFPARGGCLGPALGPGPAPALPFPPFPLLPAPGAEAPRWGRDAGPGRGRPRLLGVSRAMANVKVAVRVRPLSKRCGGARFEGSGAGTGRLRGVAGRGGRGGRCEVA